MRHEWILLMCAGVILVQGAIANPLNTAGETNRGDFESQNPSLQLEQAPSVDKRTNELADSVTVGPTEKAQINEEKIGEAINDTSSSEKTIQSSENATKVQNEIGTDVNNENDDADSSTTDAAKSGTIIENVSTPRAGKAHSLFRTSQKPSSVCTISTENYECIFKDIRLSQNETQLFGLTWKNNPQKQVTFVNSRLAYLPKKLIDAFPQMELLNAEDLQMEEIENRAFRKAANLQRLYLKNNRFTTINGFFGVPKLVHLDLSDNRLKKIDRDAFQNNKMLERILLNNNLISELPNTDAVENMQILNVTNNEIHQIYDHQFSKNNKLENLDVSFNKLSYFNLGQLDNNPLIFIDVSHNKLESLYIPKKARVLNAANNSIQVLTVNECYAEKLDLSHNQITDVTALQKCSYLTKLDLSHNRLQSFDLIKSCPNLDNLNLAHNQLFEINFPSTLHPLQIVDLSYNYLSYGPSSNFTRMKNIKLNNNKFIDFKFGTMKQLNYILISNNEWSCDKIKNIMEKKKKSVDDANEVCQKPMSSQNGICCTVYKRPFNDRLKEILRETFIHENVNRKDQEKCKQAIPISQGVEKQDIQTLQAKAANLDSARKKILEQIDNTNAKIADTLTDITTSQSNKLEQNKKLENFKRIVHVLRDHYGVINEGLISTNLTLNRVLQFTQERNNLRKDLLARREQEVEETQNRFDHLTSTITAANALNANLKDDLSNLKRKEAAVKKEKLQLEKEVNRNSPSLHSSKG